MHQPFEVISRGGCCCDCRLTALLGQCLAIRQRYQALALDQHPLEGLISDLALCGQLLKWIYSCGSPVNTATSPQNRILEFIDHNVGITFLAHIGNRRALALC